MLVIDIMSLSCLFVPSLVVQGDYLGLVLRERQTALFQCSLQEVLMYGFLVEWRMLFLEMIVVKLFVPSAFPSGWIEGRAAQVFSSTANSHPSYRPWVIINFRGVDSSIELQYWGRYAPTTTGTAGSALVRSPSGHDFIGKSLYGSTERWSDSVMFLWFGRAGGAYQQSGGFEPVPQAKEQSTARQPLIRS